MREQKHFTKSSTFDLNYLFEKPAKSAARKNTTAKSFSNEAVFDVKDLLEK